MLVIEIQRIDRGKIAEGVLHQIEAVFLSLFERFLMREDDALLERLQLYKADNAVEHIMPAVGIKFLLIDENALLVIARKDAR